MRAVSAVFMILWGLSVLVLAEDDHAHEHGGHSDDLLVLLENKIRLQKIQEKLFSEDSIPLSFDQKVSYVRKQSALLDRMLPLLKKYAAIPKSYYPNDELYQQSLENRAALLADYGVLSDGYYRSLRMLAKESQLD